MAFNFDMPAGEWWRKLLHEAAGRDPVRDRTSRQAAQQRKDFPEIVFMTVKELKRGQKFKLETPWGSLVDDVPCIDPNLGGYLKAGMTVAVRYNKVDPNVCYIRNLGPAGIQGPSSIIPPPVTLPIYGLWITPEAGPGLMKKSLQPSPQVKITTSSLSIVHGIQRLDDPEASWSYRSNYTDQQGLLAFSLGPAESPTETILAAFAPLWATNTALTGTKAHITEYSLVSNAGFDPIEIDIAVSRIARGSSDNVNRHQGYFFVHQLNESDVCYVVALDAGIVALKRSAPTTQVTSPWVEDARRFALRAGNIASVEEFLCECAYSPQAESGSVIVPGGAKFQMYERNEDLEYIPKTAVELGGLVSGITGAVKAQKRIFSVGILNQDAYANNLLSTRWPMLRYQGRHEWWLYLNLVADPMPHWLTLAINAKTAAVAVVDDFVPDLNWQFRHPNLVAVESARIDAFCVASRIPDFVGPSSLAPREIYSQTFTYDPGDPDADPPVPPGTVTLTDQINPRPKGYYYTGNILKAPYIKTNTYNSAECFQAYPMLGGGPGGGADGFSSEQIPAGVIDEATKLHFSICGEPQHVVYGLSMEDDVYIDFETDAQLANDSAWFKGNDTYPVEGRYIWWVAQFIGFDGTIYPVENPTTGASREPENDPGGFDQFGNPAGNVNMGYYLPISSREYSRKVHGEYAYELRWRQWLTVCNPDKTVKFRVDISKYYVDTAPYAFGSANPMPQNLNIWEWKPNGNYLWILRSDFIDPTPNGEGIQTSGRQEPFIELWVLGSTSATLLTRLNLHRTSDVPARAYFPDYRYAPRMLIGATTEGVPYALVWTGWNQSGSYKELITEVILNPDDNTLTRGEKWDSNPSMVEASNIVHLNGKVYYIGNNGNLVIGLNAS